MAIKLNVDEIIKLDTIRYHRLANAERDDGEDGTQSLLDDDEKNLNMLDEEDLTVLHGEDFSWFRRSVHFLLFFIGIAALLLLTLMVLPRRYTGGASFENGFGVRIPLDFRRMDAQSEKIDAETWTTKNDAKWKNAKLKQIEELRKKMGEDKNGDNSESNPVKISDQHPPILPSPPPLFTTADSNDLQKATSISGNHESLPATTETPQISTNLTKNPESPKTTQISTNSSKNQKLPKIPPIFIRPKEVGSLECRQFFEPEPNFSEYRKHRITFKDPKNEEQLPMDCESIRNRSYFQTEDLYPEEREFPIAYARAVFKDYRFLEMELAASYAPQNFYCYAIDSNASPLFHKRMRALAKCFPNIRLTTHEFHMDSSGHNMGYSHYECMKQLSKPEWNWKYMVLLQNHDVGLKTNQELIQIYKWFNGTNDISVKLPPWQRIDRKANWTFEALHLFKNESRNILPHKGFKPVLRFSKSLVQVSVSRKMIDFMLNELDMTKIMKQIDWDKYGVDEILMSTLNGADAVDAPGGYTDYCIDQHKIESAVTRLTHWMPDPCSSGMYRHSICMFGVEHMNELANTIYLFGNKVMPDRDFGAIACWHEMLFNRTHIDRDMSRLKKDIYWNLPHVRFNRERNQKGDAFDVKTFNCTANV